MAISVPELVRSIGEDAAQELFQSFAGTTIYLSPKSSDICAILGADAFAKLLKMTDCGSFPGRFCVPLARTWRAHRMRDQGKSYPEIALNLGMTENGVFRIFREKHRPKWIGPAPEGSSNRPKPISALDRAKVRRAAAKALHEEGRTFGEIAETLNMSVSSLRSGILREEMKAAQEAVQRARKQATADEIAGIEARLKAGVPLGVVALDIGTTQARLKSRLRAHHYRKSLRYLSGKNKAGAA